MFQELHTQIVMVWGVIDRHWFHLKPVARADMLIKINNDLDQWFNASTQVAKNEEFYLLVGDLRRIRRGIDALSKKPGIFFQK